MAHRQMLLDQAAEAFQKYAYTETIPRISGFRYRIISGSGSHGRTVDIHPDDDLLIVSKEICLLWTSGLPGRRNSSWW